MNPETGIDHQVTDDNHASDQSLFAVIDRWIGRIRHLSSELLELAELEMKLVALSFIEMLIVAAISILLLISAWMALIVSGVFFLVDQGLSWPASLLIAAGINGLLGIAGLLAIYRLNNNICFRTFRLLIDDYECDNGKKTTHRADAAIRDAQIEP